MEALNWQEVEQGFVTFVASLLGAGVAAFAALVASRRTATATIAAAEKATAGALEAAEKASRTAIEVAAFNERSAHSVAEVQRLAQRELERDKDRRAWRRARVEQALVWIRSRSDEHQAVAAELSRLNLDGARKLVDQLFALEGTSLLFEMRAVGRKDLQTAIDEWRAAEKDGVHAFDQALKEYEVARTNEGRIRALAAATAAAGPRGDAQGKLLRAVEAYIYEDDPGTT